MNKILLIVGLPGSGKSYFLNTLPSDDWVIIDDPTEIILPDTEKNIAYADPMFVYDNTLQKAKEYLTKHYNRTIEVLYFENNPQQCLKNVFHRDDGRKVLRFICKASEVYKPEGNIMKVWDGN